jgi:hypothetical protein
VAADASRAAVNKESRLCDWSRNAQRSVPRFVRVIRVFRVKSFVVLVSPGVVVCGSRASERRRIASLAWVQHLTPGRCDWACAKLSNSSDLGIGDCAARAMLMQTGTRRTLRSTRSHASARLITPKGGSPLRPAFFFAPRFGSAIRRTRGPGGSRSSRTDPDS